MALMTAVRAEAIAADSQPAIRKGPTRRGRRVKDSLTGYVFLVGALFCFILFTWWPMVYGVILSFQRTRRGVTSWVGWSNYERVINDPAFSHAWKNTIYFTVLALLFGYAVPFLVAVLFNELRHAQGYLRFLVYLPVMLPPASGLFLFKYLAYRPDESGWFNAALHALHLPTSQWIQSKDVAIPAMVIASTWLNMGGAVLIYLAALQNIPGELYEAAELDGASVWRRIWHVTVPQTRLILSLMAMLQVVATMQVFVEPFILANGAGAEDSSLTVAYLLYRTGFAQHDLNGSAALGVILMVVLGLLSLVYVRLSAKQD